MSSTNSSRKVVYAALAGNLVIAISKFGAGAISGSSAMLSEGIHSLVDTSNEGLLLYGLHRANKPRDESHPFGYGRELYFWSFIVALLVLALGAGMSVYEGVTHILNPEPASNLLLNLVVLGVSFVFEGITWSIALREFRKRKGDMGYFEAFRRSKDPSTFIVLLEDTAALLGLSFAAAGVLAAHWLRMPVLDGVASLCIGAVLAATALLLLRETKGLLIGEPASRMVGDSIRAVAEQDNDVLHVNGVLTVQMGPEQVVAALSVEFENERTTSQIEACIDRIERRIKAHHPQLQALFVKPQTPEAWRERRGQ